MPTLTPLSRLLWYTFPPPSPPLHFDLSGLINSLAAHESIASLISAWSQIDFHPFSSPHLAFWERCFYFFLWFVSLPPASLHPPGARFRRPCHGLECRSFSTLIPSQLHGDKWWLPPNISLHSSIRNRAWSSAITLSLLCKGAGGCFSKVYPGRQRDFCVFISA